jgi:hypothetical protein
MSLRPLILVYTTAKLSRLTLLNKHSLAKFTPQITMMFYLQPGRRYLPQSCTETQTATGWTEYFDGYQIYPNRNNGTLVLMSL